MTRDIESHAVADQKRLFANLSLLQTIQRCMI